jgi:two-component system response regulator HydG
MDKKLVVLVCDDDSLMLQVLSLRLRSMFEVHTSSSVDQAEVMLDNIKFDIAIIDINYKEQKKTGADLQDVFSRRSPATSILIYSGDNNIRRIVDVTDRKHTAVIVKGEDAFCDLITALDKMAKTILGDRLTSKGNMVTFSPKMQKVLNRIDTIIKKNNREPILILGESGVGKEHLVKYFAKKSSSKTLVSENMSCIQESLAESKLFGHTKGSFTGAVDNSIGLFEQANGGILFMDEIGEASPSTQAKLLRVLEAKEVIRVGENSPRKIDVRFIAGTHRNLKDMIKKGIFREDLYYRLNPFLITIPPLRERPEDIMYLANSFLDKLNSTCAPKEQYRFAADVAVAFLDYRWPGNIRELSNFISTLNVELPSKYLITKEDVLGLLKINSQHETEEKENAEIISESINKSKAKLELVLQACNGNITLAAELLKMHRSTFYRKMESLGIQNA